MNYSKDISLETLLPDSWLQYVDKDLLKNLENSLQNEMNLNPKSYFFLIINKIFLKYFIYVILKI